MSNEERVSQAVNTAMQAPENVLRSMFEAVYTYLDDKDVEPLARFASAVDASVRVHQIPGYDRALAAAPAEPGPPGRSLEEIFAAHAR